MKLEELKGKSWKDLKAFMADSAHALVFDGPEGTEIARTALNYGPEAGAGVACAFLFSKANSMPTTARAAIEIYDAILPGDERISELQYWVAWAGNRMPGRKDVWPVKPVLRSKDKKAGLANVMMMIVARSWADGSTTEKMVSGAIFEFLHTGMKRKGLL